MPISLATKGQFKDCTEAKNNAERRENRPLDSTDCAVFWRIRKNLSKLTKWLIGIILPLFDTYIQLTRPHWGLQENKGHGFFMNLLITIIGEVITDRGKRSLVSISPLLWLSTSSAKCQSRQSSLEGLSVARPVHAIGWKITPRIM